MAKNKTKKLWDSPIYKFRIKLEEEPKFVEIVFDVTGSAPTFEDVKDTMSEVFESFLKSDEGKKVKTVIDFGAAKLRVTRYFLRNNKKVAAVEFEELNKRSEQARRIWEECKKYKSQFKKWIFPYPFITHKKDYDLALLINVIPIMPIFVERLMVLQLLNEKIKEDGYILWYAQKEGTFYKNRKLSEKYDFGDGIWTGDNKYFKMFYKYYQIEEIDEIMLLNGFNFVRKYTAPGNDVRLYKKSKYNLLKEIITPEKILNNLFYDDTIKNPEKVEPNIIETEDEMREIVPDPSSLSIEKIYSEILNSIPYGKEDPSAPEKYHRASSIIINRIFRNNLTDMELKQDMDKTKKIIDTVFKNNAESGFFKDLSEKFKIKCPYIIVEAKNYKYDLNNEEFDQLAGRLKDNVGKFGILVCRKIDDPKIVQERCESYLDEKKYIILLTDEDLLELLNLAKENDQKGINSFMDKKIRQLIFKSK